MSDKNKTTFVQVSNEHRIILPPVQEKESVKPATEHVPAKSSRAKSTDKE